MAQTIKLKRSGTQNAVPSTSQLALGEVAINTYDGKMYIKKNDGSDSIVEIGGDATSSSGLDFTGNLNLADDVRIVIGDGNDLQIYHDGSHSYIDDAGTGGLYLRSDNFRVLKGDGSERMIQADDDGAVLLYYDGSAKISTSNDGVTVTGDVEADEFIGDLRGAILFKAQAGEALAKGDVVYISGISGNTTIVSKADANDASKMPAFGLAAAASTSGTTVEILTSGILSEVDTSAYSEGDELFVSTTAGALTNTAPTGESAALQKIGKVTRSHASSGSLFIIGAGRSNAVPNLDDGDIFIGNSSNQAVTQSLTTASQNAGALMDSEITNLAQVKAFDSSDYATAAQGTTADSALQNVVEDTSPQLGGNLDLNSNNITGTGNISNTGTITSTGNISGSNLNVTSTNWLGWGDYGERISGSNANSSLIFSTDATTALTLDSSQNATFAGTISSGAISVSSGADQILTLDQYTAGWNYIGFESSGTRKFYVGNGAGTEFVIGSDNSGVVLDISNFGSVDFNSANITAAGTISSGNITTSGYLAGPATFTIDPAAVGDNTGTVVIAGNLQVDGTTTTINSTTLTVDDKNITLASGSTNAAAANGAGITVDCGSDTDATFTYVSATDDWKFDKPTRVSGLTNAGIAFSSTETLVDGSSALPNGRIFYHSSRLIYDSPSSGHRFAVAGNQSTNLALEIYSNRDIGFYNSSGVADLLWDASTSRLGIGTAAPTYGLQVSNAQTSQSATGTMYVQASLNGSGRGLVIDSNTRTTNDNSVAALQTITRANTTGLKVQVDGKVGIGTDTPNYKLEISATGDGINLGGTGAFLRWNSGDMQIKNEGSYKMGFYTYNSSDAALNRRMVIDTNGNVGIGTNSPSWDFVVSNAGAGGLEFGPDGIGAGTSFIQAYNRTSSTYDKLRYYASEHQFYIGGGNHALNINSNGNVGIGTASPSQKLVVREGSSAIAFNEYSNGATIWLDGSDGDFAGGDYFNISAYGTTDLAFGYGATTKITMKNDGKLGIGTTSPSQKLSVNGNIYSIGGFVNASGYQLNGTYIVDSSRNLVNIGTISSGAITATGAVTISDSLVSSAPLSIGSSSQTSFTYQQWKTSSHGNTEAYIIAYGASHSSQAGNFAMKNLEANGEIFFELTNNIEPLRFASNGAATFNKAFTFPTTDGSTNQILKTDGSGNVTWATEAAVSANTSISDADGDTKIQVEESADEDKIRFDTAGTQRMVIDETGKVGINVASLSKTLTVGGTFQATGEAFLSHFDNISSASRMRDDLRLNFGTARTFAITGNSTNMHMKNGTTDVMTFDTSNRVGIGTTSPSQKLQVAGTILADTALTASSGDTAIGIGSESSINDGNSTYRTKLITQNNNAKLTTYQYSSYLTLKAGVDGTGYANNWSKIELRDGGGTGSNNAHMKFYTHGDERMVIDNGGNVGIGTTSPQSFCRLDVRSTSASSAAGIAAYGYASNGTAILGNGYAGSAAGTNYGIRGLSTGSRGSVSGSVNVGGHFQASGAVNNYALTTGSGNVGIGTTSPSRTFEIHENTTNLTIGEKSGYAPSTYGPVFETNADALVLPQYAYLKGSQAYIRNESNLMRIHGDSGIKFTYYNGSTTTEGIRLDNSGRVGIGTNSPVSNLHVKTSVDNSVAQGLVIERSANSDRGYINYNGGGFQFRSTVGDPIVFGETDAEHMRILPDGNVGIGTNSPQAKLQIEEAGIDTTTTSTSATTQVAIDTFAAATFRSARYTIQVTNSTDSTYHITEILLIHDGTTPAITEFGTIFTGSAEATFDADISSGNVRLLATPATTDSMTFKVVRHCITV